MRCRGFQRVSSCGVLASIVPNKILIKSQQPSDGNFMPAKTILRDGGTVNFPLDLREIGVATSTIMLHT